MMRFRLGYHPPLARPRPAAQNGAGRAGAGGAALWRGEHGASDGGPVRGVGQGEDEAGVRGGGGRSAHR